MVSMITSDLNIVYIQHCPLFPMKMTCHLLHVVFIWLLLNKMCKESFHSFWESPFVIWKIYSVLNRSSFRIWSMSSFKIENEFWLNLIHIQFISLFWRYMYSVSISIRTALFLSYQRKRHVVLATLSHFFWKTF